MAFDSSILNDQVTVITGASSGIGAASARALAAAGSRVVLGARSADKLNALVRDIRDAGGAATSRVTDVTSAEDLQALVEAAEQEFGQVDNLVNNAGLMLFSDWTDRAVQDWDKMIDTNLRGYLYAISAVLPQMVQRGSGRILNMSSVAGIRVGAHSGVYSATKFFIRGITDSLRQELGIQHGIQVSMISPGVIDTGWAEKVSDAEGRKVARQLNEGAISPEVIADAVVFALAQPAGVTVNDIVVHPTGQQW